MSIMSLKLSKDAFKFSSAHFLIFDDKNAERLHGHNYQVELEVFFKAISESSNQGYFIDFKELKELLKSELSKLDEFVLLPARHPEFKFTKNNNSLEVHFRDRYYVFPENEVKLLPMVNTSVEALSKYLLTEINKKLKQDLITSMRLSVAESPGQSASFEMTMK